MIRLLVVSTLYPNTAQPRHGIFVETRLRHLLATGELSAKVIAPVPWYPFDDSKNAKYISSSRIPRQEHRHGIEVFHPRYLVIPKIGMLLTPFFLALSVLLQYWQLKRKGESFDLVDGHYYYPDGVAIALISRFFKVPFTVTARGTDINLIPQMALPRKLILWTARKAAASITVCSALKDEMLSLGAQADKIHVFRNGVDLKLFEPMDREKCRDKFDIKGPALVSVGHLIERKGHYLIVEAMTRLPDYTLLIAGDGEDFEALQLRVEQLGLTERVRFLGALLQPELAELYNAADALVLASSREGWANVLLESMACGTPVVATSIWGTPEVVQNSTAGQLVQQRTAEGLADGVGRLFDQYPSRDETRRYAEGFSWDETIQGLLSLFNRLMKDKKQH